MPRLSLAVPKYRHNRPKNLAVVNFGRGRDVYLGPWKSQRSRQLCDQLITLWLQHGRTLPDDVLANFCTDDREVHVHLKSHRPRLRRCRLVVPLPPPSPPSPCGSWRISSTPMQPSTTESTAEARGKPCHQKGPGRRRAGVWEGASEPVWPA